MYCYR